MLAAQLATLLTSPTPSPASDNTWSYTLTRLSKELGQSFGILLNSAPSYSLLRLALPICQRACGNLGRSLLFNENNSGSITAESYRQYSQLLSQEIKRISEEHSEDMQTFWKDRALTLATFSRKPESWSQKNPPIPETNIPDAALLTRLNTILPPITSSSQSPKPITSRLKYRESRKQKEAGFNGIRITRQPEDMEDILISEFLNPPLLLADRLINSGYLALKRKPKHEKLNDVLIAGILPFLPRRGPDTSFTKGCWFDFICHVGWLLCRHKMLKSQFRWLQNTPLQLTHSCTFHLDHLPLPQVPDEPQPTPAFRRAFLASLGWLPPFLDTHAGSPFSGRDSSPESPDETGPYLKWAFDAWKNQTLRGSKGFTGTEPITAAQTSSHVPRVNVDTFAFVHLMIFLPAQIRDETMPVQTLLARLLKGFNIGTTEGRGVSVTWVPVNPGEAGKWAVQRSRVREPRLFAGKGELPMTEIARGLEQTWFQHLIEEIRND